MIVSEKHYARVLRGKRVTPIREIEGTSIVIARVDDAPSNWIGNGEFRNEWAFVRDELLD